MISLFVLYFARKKCGRPLHTKRFYFIDLYLDVKNDIGFVFKIMHLRIEEVVQLLNTVQNKKMGRIVQILHISL